MTRPSIPQLKAIIRELESLVQPIEAERKLASLLEPLLGMAGYDLEAAHTNRQESRDIGFDFIARKPSAAGTEGDEIAIEYKHFRQTAIGAEHVRGLLAAARVAGLRRAMLVTNARFTLAARRAIRAAQPTAIELMDLDGIRSWVGRLEEVPALKLSEVTIIRRELSKKLISLIANHPRSLDEVEWRELEHVLAELFERLGYCVTLTPASKDGGKDLILTCWVSNSQHRYYIEVKHWRSGQRVGQKAMREFLNVIVNEEVDGGLFLSTYGYCSNAVESLTEFERSHMRFGEEPKIVSLCKTYVKATAGLWSPDGDLSQLLYAETR